LAARGTPIEGWWVWWPYHGGEYARVFKTKEDADNYLPTIKPKKAVDRPPVPLGPKVTIHVTWNYNKNDWSYDDKYVYTQQNIEDQYLAQGEAA
jgi:hypothetical protein